jgi:hypothetical protein
VTKKDALNGKPYAGNPHVRFDEGEVASTTTPKSGGLLYSGRITMVAAAICMLTFVAHAETFYWKDDTRASQWRSFGSADSWAVGTTADAGNPQSKIPTASDDLYYGTDHSWDNYSRFDLDGISYTLHGVVNGDMDYATRFLYFRNGTLTFTGNLTNTCYRISVKDTGKLVLASTCGARFGRGTQWGWIEVENGGEASVYGDLAFNGFILRVLSGGTLNLQPKSFATSTEFHESISASTRFVENSGTLNLPYGLTLGGTGSGATKPVFRIYQRAGTINLGGSITRASGGWSDYELYLSGGTLNVTNDATISMTLKSVAMTNNTSFSISVADSKTLTAMGLTFGERTHLTKSGAGTLKLASTLPTELSVQEGSITFGTACDLGDGVLTMASGSTLRISALGLSATSISGIEDASVTVDGSLLSGACVLFESDSAELLSIILAKLETSGVTGVHIDGNRIVYEKSHASTVFAWKNEGSCDNKDFRGGTYSWYSFTDSASWLIGVAREANSEGYIPSEDDDIFVSASYRPIFAMDLGGFHRKVRNLELNIDASTGKYENQAGFRQFNIRNGTLEFSGSFTNMRAEVVAKDTGRFVFGRTSAARFGYNGAEDYFIAESGGEINFLGALDYHIIFLDVDAGGKIVLDPTSLTQTHKSNIKSSRIRNNGRLELTNGLRFERSASGISSTVAFDIIQESGTLVLGGSIVRESNFLIPVNFAWNGGTITVTNNASFENLGSVTMASGTTGTVEVAEGKVLNLSTMTFGEDTKVVRSGSGRIIFGKSRPTVYDRGKPLSTTLIFR